MRCLTRALAVLILLAPSVVIAEGPGPLPYKQYTSGISALALTSDRTTSTLNVGGYKTLSVEVRLTDGGSAGTTTSIDVTCEVSKDGTNWSWVLAKQTDGATGISTSQKKTDRLPLSVTGSYTSTWGIADRYARFTIHGNGAPEAGDTIVVTVLATAVDTPPEEAIAPQCIDLDAALISAQGMDSSRSFSLNRSNSGSSYRSLIVYADLTDANTSITRLDLTCTSSVDGNTTDFTPQRCKMVNGVCSKSTPAKIWRKASPGSSKWEWVIPLNGSPDTECTFSVGSGSGAAGDTLTVLGRLCTDAPPPDVDIGQNLCTVVPASGETITSTDLASDISAQLKPSTRYQISFVTSSWFDTATSASCTAASGDPQFPGPMIYEFTTSETVMWVCARNVTAANSAYLWECE